MLAEMSNTLKTVFRSMHEGKHRAKLAILLARACSRESMRHSLAMGTMEGSSAATWLGAVAANCLSIFSAPSRTCESRGGGGAGVAHAAGV